MKLLPNLKIHHESIVEESEICINMNQIIEDTKVNIYFAIKIQKFEAWVPVESLNFCSECHSKVFADF